jgi:ribosomal-protein-alanine acetyltransferase
MDALINNVVFRKAALADLDAILKIEQEGFEWDGFSRKQMRYLMKSDSSGFFVGESDGSVVGYMILLLRKNSHHIRIYSIAVSEAARGKGLGQSFLQLAEKWALEKSKNRLKLEVRTTNTAAINLYKRNQFSSVKVVSGYYHDGGDALIMLKELLFE